jgi:hypothetical protein
VLGSGSSEYEHGQTDFRGNQHTTKATAPMTDRTRTVGVTPSPIHAPVPDKPTRGKHYRSFQNDRCGLA